MTLSPLQGFTVGITANRRADEQAQLFERRGATVVRGAVISTEYLGSDDALRAATDAVIAHPPTYLIATTGIGMRAWFEAAQTWGAAVQLTEALRTATIFARGPKAASAVRAGGLDVHVSAATERMDELVMELLNRPLAGARIAFQHYGAHRADATDALRAHGADVVDVPVYRWRAPDDRSPADRLIDATCDGDIDAVTFTSAPAVKNFFELARDRGKQARLLDAFNHRGVVAACIGPVCAEGASEAGIETSIAPLTGRLGLLVRALDDSLGRRRTTIDVAGASVIVQGRVVVVNGNAVELTRRERAILEALMRRAGTVVAKSTLVRDVWNDQVDPHAVEATIGRLRRRLGPGAAIVKSVRGRGYLVDVPNAHEVPT